MLCNCKKWNSLITIFTDLRACVLIWKEVWIATRHGLYLHLSTLFTFLMYLNVGLKKLLKQYINLLISCLPWRMYSKTRTAWTTSRSSAFPLLSHAPVLAHDNMTYKSMTVIRNSQSHLRPSLFEDSHCIPMGMSGGTLKGFIIKVKFFFDFPPQKICTNRTSSRYWVPFKTTVAALDCVTAWEKGSPSFSSRKGTENMQ